jgi:hypothetical protein
MLTGKSITGEVYIRKKFGPVPKHIMPIRAELARDGAMSIIDSRGDGDITKFRSLISPNATGFSPDELSVVDYWIDHIDKDHTATSISEFSHDYRDYGDSAFILIKCTVTVTLIKCTVTVTSIFQRESRFGS